MALANPFLKGIEQDTTVPVSNNFDTIINIESRGQQFDKFGKTLTSSAGAVGQAQILPTTGPEAASLAGVSYSEQRLKNDPEYNRTLGNAYFNKQLDTFGDPAKAAAAYNAGPGAVRKAIDKHGDNWLEHLPEETKKYVASFTGEKVTSTPPETKSTINPFLKGVDTGNPFLKGISTEETPKPEEKGLSIIEAAKLVPSNLIAAGKGLVGEALSLANIAAGTPEFITKVGSQLVNAPATAIENAVQGKPPVIDWEKSTARSAELGKTLFGPLSEVVPKATEVTGLKPAFEESAINKGLEALSSGMESAATKIEETTGIPKAGSLAVMETAMVTGVPGVKAVAKRVARNVNDLVSLNRMDPGSKEWTGKDKPWVVPETTDTGIPISTGAVTMPDGTAALDAQGRPVIARHWRNDDGTSSHIQLNLDEAAKRFEEKPWVKAGLSEGTFKTPTEYAQFILEHEAQHTRLSFEDYKKMVGRGDLFKETTGLRSEEQLRRDYEHFTNKQALESIKTDPIIGQPDVTVPKIPKDTSDPQWLDDAFYSLGKAKSHDSVISSLRLKAAEADGVDIAMKQRWRDAAEGHGKLDPHETELFKKYYVDEATERVKLLKYAQDKGWVLPTELDPSITGTNVARKIVPKKLTRLEKAKAALSGGKFGGFDPNIKAKPGAALERNLFVGELPTGKRIVLQEQLLDTGETRIVQWRNGKATPYASGVKLKAGEKIGSTKIKEAYEAEIEKHTPYEYEKDTQAVLYERLTELREFTRANQFLEDLTQSPWMSENAHKISPTEPIPDGYKRPKHIDKIPQFEGYAFKDHVAEIIEDFAISRNPNALTFLSGALIKNMMINPLPHMMNEAWHVYNARGLTGWVTPAGIYRFVRTGMPALKSALTQDKAYRETLLEGGSIMSADVRANAVMDNFYQKGLKEFADTPEFKELAKEMGMTPLKAYDAISKKSNIAMWTVRDAMYLQLINEKMRYDGMTRAEAIKEVERHLPAYRIPHRVMGSRMLSEVLQNPNVTIFSRYHYGLVNSLKETAKDIGAIRKGRAGVKDFLHGLDTAAAIAVAVAVLYPLQDMAAQWLSGNEEAKQRRAGPYHIFHAIAGIAEHEKDPMAFISSIFTFNPALLAGAQLIMNRKIYNGQPVYHPEDSPKKIAYDITKYVVTQLPMASQAEKAQKEEDEGFKNWQMRQLDIESPTAETAIKREKQKNIREKAGSRRTGKWEAGF
jgi:hypothetical protein